MRVMVSPHSTAGTAARDGLAAPRPHWLEPSNAHGSANVVKNLVPLLALYAALPHIADRSVVLAWCCTPVVGLLLYRLTMVMHDCGHATLFTTRRANETVGKLLGFITGVDFGRFKQRHWEHHKGYGQAGDPQGFHYLGLANMPRSTFIWHVAKPLLGINLRYVFRESLLHPANLKTAVASGDAVPLLLVQIGLAALVTAAWRQPSLALLPPVAAATFGLFLRQLRGIAEHGVGDPGRSEVLVRSHAREWLGALLLYDVHFNYHDEHHRYPGVPSRHLPALARELAPERRLPTIWQTLRTRAR